VSWPARPVLCDSQHSLAFTRCALIRCRPAGVAGNQHSVYTAVKAVGEAAVNGAAEDEFFFPTDSKAIEHERVRNRYDGNSRTIKTTPRLRWTRLFASLSLGRHACSRPSFHSPPSLFLHHMLLCAGCTSAAQCPTPKDHPAAPQRKPSHRRACGRVEAHISRRARGNGRCSMPTTLIESEAICGSKVME
jgi:hypothetical protein